MRARLLVIRAALLYLVLTCGLVGFWALLNPQGFYDRFPGFGVWVAGDGPYNEHLLRDVGSLNLSLAVLALLAWWRPSRVNPRAVGLAALVYAAPHLAYHLTHLNTLPRLADRVESAAALIVAVLVPLLLCWPPAAVKGDAVKA